MDALPVIIVVGAFVLIGWLSQRGRRKAEDYRREMEARGEIVAPAPVQQRSRPQRRVETAAAAPVIPTISIEDIAKAEAADLGLADLPGAAELPVNIQLLVYRRYEDIANRCDGQMRYEISDGVAPDQATVDDVRLVCDGEILSAPAAANVNPPVEVDHETPEIEPDGNNLDG